MNQAILKNHISKKKKNTYTIGFNVMIDMGLFAYMKHTPMPLITINGEKQLSQSRWIQCKEFPNPCANEMAQSHTQTADKMGAKISITIIEYLDKETNKPVVQLYPESMYIFPEYGAGYKSHLNHATRRDLQKEINRRMMILGKTK